MLARMPVVFWTLIEAGRYAGNFLLAHKLMIRYVKGFLWDHFQKDFKKISRFQRSRIGILCATEMLPALPAGEELAVTATLLWVMSGTAWEEFNKPFGRLLLKPLSGEAVLVRDQILACILCVGFIFFFNYLFYGNPEKRHIFSTLCNYELISHRGSCFKSSCDQEPRLSCHARDVSLHANLTF